MGPSASSSAIPCPICASANRRPLVAVRNVPLVACLFPSSREQALASECGDIDLSSCVDCGHVYNCSFAVERLAYVSTYENALGFSRRHRAHMEATVDRLIEQHDLRGKTIVEIGCGAADLLRYLCREGANRGIGYDPSRPTMGPEAVGAGSFEVIGKPFDDAVFDIGIDVVCSQHVLEHLPCPVETLRKARELLTWGGFAYMEVPNGDGILRGANIWDLTYEHVSYFSPASLRRAVADSGFAILRQATSFGDQYLEVEAVVDKKMERTPDRRPATSDALDAFPGQYFRIVDDWRRRLADWRHVSRRVVLWGAGTKAVTFLNIIGADANDVIDFVVDVNPRKADRFIPGTAQQIKEPAFLKDFRPDTVIVMNPEYLGEIGAQIREMGVNCELIPVTAVPTGNGPVVAST